ncbi:MAG: ABC transporter ATP-binding protein [Anaerolineaceae bacterium]|nr:ABC transporter ATP-binding protein [Anaerolineaceae bacterium]
MLKLIEISKSYEGQPLLKGISLSVGQGETLCLLGPSGSGKSTLLRIIAGLEGAESGQVLWDGQDLIDVPSYRRNFGLMFQDYALFPHRNVAQNVAFGLRMHGLPQEEIDQRVRVSLEMVNLSDFAGRRVTDLSGGEQQRVALARALAPGPRLLMLDEPLAALDRTLREQLSLQLRHILRTTGIPAIYVTHDQEEAFAIADRLALLDKGVVAQSGTPAQVYNHPASVWVARFLGLGNILEGALVSTNPLQVRTHLGVVQVSCTGFLPQVGQAVMLLLRPGHARVITTPGLNTIQGVVADVVFRGEVFRVTLRTGNGAELIFSLPEAPERGQKLTISIPPEELVCLDHA